MARRPISAHSTAHACTSNLASTAEPFYLFAKQQNDLHVKNARETCECGDAPRATTVTPGASDTKVHGRRPLWYYLTYMEQTLRTDLIAAMKAHDELRVSVLRGLISAMTNELVATNRKPTDKLADDEILALIRRGVKQRKDSIDQFRKGGREDLAQKEEAEIVILSAYLPAMMSRADIEKIVRAKKEAMGVTDKAQAGKFMGVIMQELKGKADGNDVKAVIDSLFV